jgi:NADH-quinone oxidoreductase subunit L
MVTAGVYMIGRNAALFSHAPQTMEIVAVIGAVTALVAGTIGLVQNDIKRVLAYSTVSQLGYMFLAMGVGAFTGGIFHLYTHAFFKALMFLGAGAVIHALGGEQDMRKMGGLKAALPITYWTFVVGALAIAGFPLLSGFFSKDEILYRAFESGHTVLWALGLLTALLTATYMFRLVFMTFHGERSVVPAAGHGGGHGDDSGSHGAHGAGHGTHLHDAPAPMALALIVLAFGSIVAGYVGVPHAIGGSNRIETFLEPSLSVEAPSAVGEPAAPHEAGGDTSNELTLMAVSTGVALAGIGIAAFFFLTNRGAADQVAAQFSGLQRLLANKYYVDEIYDGAIVQPVRLLSEEGLWKGVDARGIDGAVNGTAQGIAGLASLLRRLQSGSVRAYAAGLVCGVVLVLGYYLWR